MSISFLSINVLVFVFFQILEFAIFLNVTILKVLSLLLSERDKRNL